MKVGKSMADVFFFLVDILTKSFECKSFSSLVKNGIALIIIVVMGYYIFTTVGLSLYHSQEEYKKLSKEHRDINSELFDMLRSSNELLKQKQAVEAEYDKLRVSHLELKDKFNSLIEQCKPSEEAVTLE